MDNDTLIDNIIRRVHAAVGAGVPEADIVASLSEEYDGATIFLAINVARILEKV